MVWIILGLLLLIMIFIIMISKVYITLGYTYQNHAHTIMVKVKMYQFSLYSNEWHVKKQDDIDLLDMIMDWDLSGGTDGLKNRMKNSLQKMKNFGNILKRLLAKTHFHQLHWQTVIGTGNASTTGIITGGIWTIKGSIIALLKELGNVSENPTIIINPNFQMKQLESKIDCIVSIRIGQAIYTVFKSLRKSTMKKEAYI
ncbi:DUF2953 domain-containing protein [Ornithinibacillus salinisoli]|uniref:DUF2953 domain-containing protein n=1 Tax=Ornithinibacillus salinisoli TaxID=1848459 RepID=A0ABW4W3J3_9BACI